MSELELRANRDTRSYGRREWEGEGEVLTGCGCGCGTGEGTSGEGRNGNVGWPRIVGGGWWIG